MRGLNPKQLACIKEDLIAGSQKHGFESEMWAGKMIVEHVRGKYNIEYVTSTMQRLMHDMGFHTSSQDQSIKSASNEEKKAFKKNNDRLGA